MRRRNKNGVEPCLVFQSPVLLILIGILRAKCLLFKDLDDGVGDDVEFCARKRCQRKKQIQVTCCY